MSGRIISMAPVGRSKRLAAGTEGNLGRRAVPSRAGRPVQRLRDAALGEPHLHARPVARRERQEGWFGGIERPAPDASPQGEAVKRARAGGGSRNAAGGRRRALDRRNSPGPGGWL